MTTIDDDRNYWRTLRAQALAESWRLRVQARNHLRRGHIYPIGPILDVATRLANNTPTIADGQLVAASDRRVADILGIHPRTVWRWRNQPDTRLDYLTADRLCVKQLGLHPACVYGDLWHDINDALADAWTQVA